MRGAVFSETGVCGGVGGAEVQEGGVGVVGWE